MKAYLDNGATTRVAKEVLAEVNSCFTKEYGNASSLHSCGQIAREILENSRKTIAAIISAEPDEIYFTSGGTESDNLAIRGACYARKGKGSHIITSAIEHPAVIESFRQLEKEGFTATYLPVTKEGLVRMEDLRNAINDKTILVSIMHANNEIGTIQDLAAIGKLCKEREILFHSDAVQSFTKLPINVKEMNIDLLSISAHKIHGPKGVGALYVKKGLRINKQMFGGPQEGNLRAGTENIPGIAGLAKAATLISNEDLARIKNLRDRLISGLLKIPDTYLNGPIENRLCNNANISFRFIEGESLLLTLDSKGVAVSTGSACSSRDLKPSHVLIATGCSPEEAHSSLRFTLSRYTTEKEIDYAINITAGAVKKLRKLSPLGKK